MRLNMVYHLSSHAIALMQSCVWHPGQAVALLVDAYPPGKQRSIAGRVRLFVRVPLARLLTLCPFCRHQTQGSEAKSNGTPHASSQTSQLPKIPFASSHPMHPGNPVMAQARPSALCSCRQSDLSLWALHERCQMPQLSTNGHL